MQNQPKEDLLARTLRGYYHALATLNGEASHEEHKLARAWLDTPQGLVAKFLAEHMAKVTARPERESLQ